MTWIILAVINWCFLPQNNAVKSGIQPWREAWEYMRSTEMAAELLALRSVTFYFGAFAFTELTRHSVGRAVIKLNSV